MGKGTKRQTIKHLPEELIGEILSNLPVKPLLRFKSVSKPWRSLIRSEKFVKEHLNRSISDPDLAHHNLIGIFYANKTGLSLSSCPLKPFLVEPNQDDVVSTRDHDDRHEYFVNILGSCNGLLLINGDTDLSFWNPSIGKLKEIPHPSISQADRKNPPWNYSVYGFGYDDSTDDYKVVWVGHRYVQGRTEIHHRKWMYSARTNSWKKIESFDKRFESSVHCQGTFVNGKLHWLGRVEVKGGDSLPTIASLGLVEGEEKYRVVPMPSNIDAWRATLANLGGYLSLIESADYYDINVWIMTKYGVAESWTKIWTLSDFHYPGLTYDSSIQPFWVTKNGDIFVAFDKSKVVVYNAENEVREYQLDKNELESPRMNPYALDDDDFDDCLSRLELPLIVYVESLVSPYYAVRSCKSISCLLSFE